MTHDRRAGHRTHWPVVALWTLALLAAAATLVSAWVGASPTLTYVLAVPTVIVWSVIVLATVVLLLRDWL